MNNNLKVVADYHTHTIYSDGKGTIEQNVKSAIDKGLEIIGISDHGYKHMGFGVKYNLFEKMRYEIDLMKEKYPQIKILLGVECNILDDRGNIDIDDKILRYFDYVMAGYHFGSMPTRWTSAASRRKSPIRLLSKCSSQLSMSSVKSPTKTSSIG